MKVLYLLLFSFIPFLPLTIIPYFQTNITSVAWKNNERYKTKMRRGRKIKTNFKFRKCPQLWWSPTTVRILDMQTENAGFWDRDHLILHTNNHMVTNQQSVASTWLTVLFCRDQCLKFKFSGSLWKLGNIMVTWQQLAGTWELLFARVPLKLSPLSLAPKCRPICHPAIWWDTCLVRKSEKQGK